MLAVVYTFLECVNPLTQAFVALVRVEGIAGAVVNRKIGPSASSFPLSFQFV